MMSTLNDLKEQWYLLDKDIAELKEKKNSLGSRIQQALEEAQLVFKPFLNNPFRISKDRTSEVWILVRETSSGDFISEEFHIELGLPNIITKFEMKVGVTRIISRPLPFWDVDNGLYRTRTQLLTMINAARGI